jgi:UDP-N-acetylglucosamine 2-epimerase (non-hydrolysing)
MKLILVCGARPNFMKIAPLIRAIDKYNHASPYIEKVFHYILVHTGQHYDYEMSQVFFKDLEIPQPDIHLGVGAGTHAEQTAKVMIEFEKVLYAERPDLVVVVGDVNSTLAAALAAVKLHIPVAHVEAGIRSYDKTMPEEINRLLTDHVSDYLFTTSLYDDENLKIEGIPEERIFRVGNCMVDSLLSYRPAAQKSDILSRLDLTAGNYILLTFHRPSNVDNREHLVQLLSTINRIARKIPVVFPVHPRTRKNIGDYNINNLVRDKNIIIIDPAGYVDFLCLEMNAKLVITDSGGIQVETTILNVPCLTVLDSPVWTITHEVGTNILVGNDGNRIIAEAEKIIEGGAKKGSCPELWDGKTSERIVTVLSNHPERAEQE